VELTGARDGEEAKSPACHLPVVVDALDEGDEILHARRKMLHTLPELLEEGVHVAVLTQGIVDG
jgi:hypothetical protein